MNSVSASIPDKLVSRRSDAPPRQRRRGPRGTGSRLTYSAMALPSLLLMILVNAYPVFYAAMQSVHDGSLISQGDFIGLDNYIAAASDSAFWAAAQFTIIFTLVGVFGSWLIGLSLALLLRTKIPGRAVFRVLLVLPWVVPVVVSATSWNWLTAQHDSPLPMLARALGMGDVLFLANPTLAVITVCAFKVWISFPFMMMMMGAALEGIDPTVYEAARMDGANSRQQLFGITLPLIAKPTYIGWVLMTIFCVNDFPTIFLLTGGGPVNATTSMVVFAYRLVFLNFQTGYGVAIAFLMTILLVIVSVILYRQIRKVGNHE